MSKGLWYGGEEPSNFWFLALVTLLTLAVVVHFCVGPSQDFRPTYIGAVLVSMVFYQFNFLFYACMKLPVNWQSSLYRWDCLKGTKAGKHGWNNENEWDVNPCWCNDNATCAYEGGFYNATTFCPLPTNSSGFSCTNDITGADIQPYLDSFRDCREAYGPRCTLQEPCTPCDLQSLQEFILAGYQTSRCTTCLVGINSGQCNFVLNEGPYCLKRPGSTEVQPCETCCSEGTQLWINDTCY